MKRTPYAHILVLTAFLFNSLGPVSWAQSSDFHLPAPGVMVRLSPPLDPPMLKGIRVHPDNPFQFEFILDQGDSGLAEQEQGAQQEQLRIESTKLIKYFLASLTIPDKDLWVNLSPYEKQRIIPQSFGLTEMGRDLLAEDYMLKQITASLIYPEDSVGKKFWKRVYEQAAKKFGTTNIPVNTFNKVWIVPEKAVVYENAKAGTAYVVESKLKVMLEQDYLSMSRHVNASETQKGSINALGSQVVREIVIPELNKEVNEGKNFSHLRQVYNSLILAAWYKKKIKDSILQQIYTDKNKTSGLSFANTSVGNTQYIYQQYLKAFKKGVYNYIKEDIDQITQQTIPRKYFSGGTTFDDAAMSSALSFTEDASVLSQGGAPDRAQIVEVRLTEPSILSKFERLIESTLQGAREHGQNALLDYNTEGQKQEIIDYLRKKSLEYFEIVRGEDGFLRFPTNKEVRIYVAPAGLELRSGEAEMLLDDIGLEHSETFTNIGKVAIAQEAAFAYPSMDALTNLPNKEGYKTLFTKEIQRQLRQEKIHIVIPVMDLDGFKDINDFFGHINGDKIIVKLADTLKNSIRTTDSVARWGGDEFVMIWPVTEAYQGVPEHGKKLLKMIRDGVYLDKEYVISALDEGSVLKMPKFYDKLINQFSVQNGEPVEYFRAKFPTLDDAVRAVRGEVVKDDGTPYFKGWVLTASMGAVEYESASNGFMASEEIRELSDKLFKQADALLYDAKQGGKNQIVAGKFKEAEGQPDAAMRSRGVNLSQEEIAAEVRRLVSAAPVLRSLREVQEADLVDWLQGDQLLPDKGGVFKNFWNNLVALYSSGSKDIAEGWMQLLAQKWQVPRDIIRPMVVWMIKNRIAPKDVSEGNLNAFMKVFVENHQKFPNLGPTFVYSCPLDWNADDKMNFARINIEYTTEMSSPDFERNNVVLKSGIPGTKYFVGVQYSLAESTNGFYVTLGEEQNNSQNPLKGVFFRIGLDTQGDDLRVIMMQGVKDKQKEIKDFSEESGNLHPGVALMYIALELAAQGHLRFDHQGFESAKNPFKHLMGIYPEFIPTMKNGIPTINILSNYTRFGLRQKTNFVPVTKSDLSKSFPKLEGLFDWLMQRGYFEEGKGTVGRSRHLTEEMINELKAQYPADFTKIMDVLQKAFYRWQDVNYLRNVFIPLYMHELYKRPDAASRKKADIIKKMIAAFHDLGPIDVNPAIVDADDPMATEARLGEEDSAQLSSNHPAAVVKEFVDNIAETAYDNVWNVLQFSLNVTKRDNSAYQQKWEFVKRDIMYQQEICVRAVTEFLKILKNRFQDSNRVRSELGDVNIWNINYHEFIATIEAGKVLIIDPTYQQLIPQNKPGPSRKVLTVELSKLSAVAGELGVPGGAEIWMTGLRQNAELWQKITSLPDYQGLRAADQAMTVNQKRVSQIKGMIPRFNSQPIDTELKQIIKATMIGFLRVVEDKRYDTKPDEELFNMLDGIAARHYYGGQGRLQEFRGYIPESRFLMGADAKNKRNETLEELINRGILVKIEGKDEVWVRPYTDVREVVRGIAGNDYAYIWSVMLQSLLARAARGKIIRFMNSVLGANKFDAPAEPFYGKVPEKPVVAPPVVTPPVTGPVQLDLFDRQEDKAQLANLKGGIDLTPSKMNLQLQNAGEGIKFHLDPVLLQQLQNAPGFVPVIINIHPMNDLRKFLGINGPQNLISV